MKEKICEKLYFRSCTDKYCHRTRLEPVFSNGYFVCLVQCSIYKTFPLIGIRKLWKLKSLFFPIYIQRYIYQILSLLSLSGIADCQTFCVLINGIVPRAGLYGCSLPENRYLKDPGYFGLPDALSENGSFF